MHESRGQGKDATTLPNLQLQLGAMVLSFFFFFSDFSPKSAEDWKELGI
jgi:hypothetical protein